MHNWVTTLSPASSQTQKYSDGWPGKTRGPKKSFGLFHSWHLITSSDILPHCIRKLNCHFLPSLFMGQVTMFRPNTQPDFPDKESYQFCRFLHKSWCKLLLLFLSSTLNLWQMRQDTCSIQNKFTIAECSPGHFLLAFLALTSGLQRVWQNYPQKGSKTFFQKFFWGLRP